MPFQPRTLVRNGFTLIELSIALVIIALLLGGLMMPLAAQRDLKSSSETQKQLASLNEALLGFASVNGRLPCPAAPSQTGEESLSSGTASSGGPCANPWDGFLPAITLGIGPVDAQGYAVDRWGNRIRYAVTTSNSSAFTTSGEVKALWGNSPSTLVPDLSVCSTSTGIIGSGANAQCATGRALTTSAVVVIYSQGGNGGGAASSADELANIDTRRTFVSHTPTPAGNGAEFDDLLVWLSPNTLYYRLISAGQLP